MPFHAPSVAAIVLILVILTPHMTYAQDDWGPPEPSPESFDWIKLTSGEWLKGEIKGKRDLDFEFDSDELGLLILDWGDIAEISFDKADTPTKV